MRGCVGHATPRHCAPLRPRPRFRPAWTLRGPPWQIQNNGLQRVVSMTTSRPMTRSCGAERCCFSSQWATTMLALVSRRTLMMRWPRAPAWPSSTTVAHHRRRHSHRHCHHSWSHHRRGWSRHRWRCRPAQLSPHRRRQLDAEERHADAHHLRSEAAHRQHGGRVRRGGRLVPVFARECRRQRRCLALSVSDSGSPLHQWRAPGAAPVYDSCGMAAGHPPPTPKLNFGGIYVNTSNAKVGDRGSEVLKPAPSGSE